MRRIAGLAAAIVVAAMFLPVSGALAATDAETQALENRIKELEQRLDAMDKKPEDETSLQQRVEDLEKKLGDKLTAGYDGRFFVQTADGEYRMNFGGFTHMDGRFPFNGDSKSNDAFLFRRVRLGVDGYLTKQWEYKVELDVADKSTSKAYFTDAYLNWHYWDALQVKAGNYKVPFSLEELTSDNSLRFIERSPLNGMVPSRRTGVGIGGTPLPSGLINYNVGVFNGSQTGSFMTAGRVALDLASVEGIGFLRNFTIGGNAAIDHDAGAAVATKYETDMKTQFFKYATGVTSSGDTLLKGADLSFWRGPFGFVAEYMASTADLRKTGSADKTFTNDGYYLQASYVLTGEKATAKGVTPARSFDPAKGQWGAVEIAGRYTSVAVDGDVFTNNYAARPANTDGADVYTAGVNWYLNKNIRLMLNYEHADFNSPLTSGSKGEDGAITRLQLVF